MHARCTLPLHVPIILTSSLRSGSVPAGAASVMDQKQGQASSHVPIGFSIRISCAYGIHDWGSRSSHVPVTSGRCT